MYRFEDARACRDAGITYHLASAQEWNEQKATGSYLPDVFPTDGFIHCTNGVARMLEIANLFYQGNPEPRTLLAIRLDALTSPVRYDDPDEAFPHVYGPLNTDAVVGELAVVRDTDGAFVEFR